MRRDRDRGHAWLIAVALGGFAPAALAAEAKPELPPAADAQPRALTAGSPTPVGVTINGRSRDTPALVVAGPDGIWILQSDLVALGLHAHPQAIRPIAGEMFASLSSIPGVRAQLADEGTTLNIDADAAAFGGARLSGGRTGAVLSDIAPAAFLDYDLSIVADGGQASISGLVEAGISGRWGVLGSSALVASQGRQAVRLDTTLRIDLPGRRQQLLVGDALTRGTSWNQPVRIGGLRFGTDLSLDPTFVAMATPVLSGSATLPSTIDLLPAAGNRSFEIGPGQFQLDYYPQVTGAGEVTMVVRDLAGTERRITRRFYTGGDVLQPGLSEFSIEIGALRQAYGQRSFSYGAPTISGYWRRGLTSWATVAVQGMASGTVRTGGAEAALRIGHFAIATLSAAGSHGPDGNGMLARAQVQRLTAGYSLTASYQRNSTHFRQIGAPDGLAGNTEELAIAGGVSLPRSGTLNASLVHLRRGNERQRLASLSYAQNLGRAYLSVGVREARFGTGRATSGFAALTLPFGVRSHASLTADSRSIAASFDHAAPPGRGFGYRGVAGIDRNRDALWLEAGALLRSSAGQIDATIVSRGGAPAVRMLLQGGLVSSEGQLAATPRIQHGLAVVSVASETPVGVTVENRDTARTARSGHPAIVTGLEPYAANRIGIDVDALPITDIVASGEQIAVPGWRQVARVRFGGASQRPVRLRLIDQAGQPIAPGTRVHHGIEATLVGHDGEVFLVDAAPGQVLRVHGRHGPCEAVLAAAAAGDDFSRRHELQCLPPIKELEP